MLGTFAGALDARKINAQDGRLRCEVRGEVEDDGGVLIIKRVHGVYAQGCPVYRSLIPAFPITSSVEIVNEASGGYQENVGT